MYIIYFFTFGCAESFCMGFSVVEKSRGCSLATVLRLLMAVASLVVMGSRPTGFSIAACGLSCCGSRAQEHRLSICETQASLLCVMWHLPRSWSKPVSPALTDQFFTTEPPEKPKLMEFNVKEYEKCTDMISYFTLSLSFKLLSTTCQILVQ